MTQPRFVSLIVKLAKSVRAIIRFDATAGVRMAAEILEGEWREIGETATGEKTRNAAGIETLCGLDLFRSCGRSEVMYGASSAIARECQEGSVDRVGFRTHTEVWHFRG